MGNSEHIVKYKTDWMKEEIQSVPKNRILLSLCEKVLRRKLTYSDLYLIIYGLNRGMGDENAKRNALEKILIIYEFNNKKTPKLK